MNLFINLSYHNILVITSATLDFSPILLGILFTLLLLCLTIFLKVYCKRTSNANNELHADTKQMNNISYKQDALKVRQWGPL